MKSFLTIRACTATACLAATLLTCHAADGDKKYLPWEKGSVKFGGFAAAFDSSIGFGINHSAGVTIDAEELLDLDSSLTVLRLEAMYRPGKSLRHQVDVTWAAYHRDGKATLEEDITINGTTYPVGAQIETKFNFDIVRGTYTYAFLQDERMRIGAGLGLYAIPVEYGLDIRTTSGRSSVDGADTILPLPALALRAEFQLIPKLYLNATLDAMYLEIDSFKGSLMDVNVGVEYRPWKHVGFGVGYSALSVKAEGESESAYPGADFVGSVDVRYSGLLLYGKFSF